MTSPAQMAVYQPFFCGSGTGSGKHQRHSFLSIPSWYARVV